MIESERYVDRGWKIDPVVIHTDVAAEPYLQQDETSRPIGFQRWRQYGAPPDAPGKAKHHPAVKEHEFIGWILAMHFLTSLELVLAWDMNMTPFPHHYNHTTTPTTGDDDDDDDTTSPTTNLGPPQAQQQPSYFDSLSPEMVSILYGHPTKTTRDQQPPSTSTSPNNNNNDTTTNHNDDIWTISPISCRTTFQPTVNDSATATMDDIIISGMAPQLDSLMLPKGLQYYNQGWVLDLGVGEKKAKRNLLRYGGLGFIDSKEAYYGIYASGPIHFFLPYEHKQDNATTTTVTMRDERNKRADAEEDDDSARSWFRSIVVCEVNEKRGVGECNMEKDVSYVVGGSPVTNVDYIHAEGTAYLGKPICVILSIPPQATITTRNKEQEPQLQEETTTDVEDIIGVTLTISVINKAVSLKKGPCSISHIIWEQEEHTSIY